MGAFIPPIPNFDRLPRDKAYHILVDEIAPICKENRVKITIYDSTEFLTSVKNYKKREHLCSVEKVQKIFSFLDYELANSFNQSIGLYSVKHIINEKKGENVTHGECIAAMLLKGYIADFAVDRSKLKVNCQFYKKLNNPYEGSI